MDRLELAACLARDVGLSREQAAQALQAVTHHIQRAIAAGNDVVLGGFGVFSVANRQARTVRVHQTGEELHFPACRVVVFDAERIRLPEEDQDHENVWNVCVKGDERQWQERAMDILSQETEYTDAIIELASDMIVSVDGNRDIKIFNKAASETLGYTREEMKALPIAAIYADHDEYLAVGDAMRTQGGFTGEITCRKKNGDLFPARITALLVRDKGGKVIGSVGYSRDLTEERAAAAAREELAVMKATEEMKRDVENITRHDLKSPINGMVGFAEMLLHDDSLSEDHRDSVRQIKELGYRTINMVNLSLGLLKMEKGTYQLEPRQIDLHALIRGILSDLGNQFKFKRIEVAVRVGGRPAQDREPCFAQCEELLSYSLFANLIKNAVGLSQETPDHD